MRWEIYYIHPQCGHTLFVDTILRVSVRCPAAAAICSSNKHTYIDRKMYLARITENNGCLVVPSNKCVLSVLFSKCYDN